MPSSTRLSGALEQLFAELEELAEWEADIATEARRAARRREKLATSVRVTVETLFPSERGPHLARLRSLLGAADPMRPKRRPTPRTRAALRWLARREPATFSVAELRAHFESKGLPTGRHYLPTLLFRYAAAGIVTQTEHGRYCVNRDHPDLAGV